MQTIFLECCFTKVNGRRSRNTIKTMGEIKIYSIYRVWCDNNKNKTILTLFEKTNWYINSKDRQKRGNTFRFKGRA